MVFNEHGRVAIINPLVLMHMFSSDNWAYHEGSQIRDLIRIRNSYIKKGMDSRLKREFGNEIREWPNGGCTGGIVKTAWSIARCVCLTLQETLSLAERGRLKDILASVSVRTDNTRDMH